MVGGCPERCREEVLEEFFSEKKSREEVFAAGCSERSREGRSREKVWKEVAIGGPEGHERRPSKRP